MRKTTEGKTRNTPSGAANTPPEAGNSACGQLGGKDSGIAAPQDPPVRLSPAQVEDFIASHHWKATVRPAPHEYTLRANARNQREFDNFVMHIREQGYIKKFGRSKYTYLKIGTLVYWTMGWPLHETILINRAKEEA